MSDRKSCSSTQYGPSVTVGVVVAQEVVAASAIPFASGLPLKSAAAPPNPKIFRALRRFHFDRLLNNSNSSLLKIRQRENCECVSQQAAHRDNRRGLAIR